jgi:hypothetical protein
MILALTSVLTLTTPPFGVQCFFQVAAILRWLSVLKQVCTGSVLVIMDPAGNVLTRIWVCISTPMNQLELTDCPIKPGGL